MSHWCHRLLILPGKRKYNSRIRKLTNLEHAVDVILNGGYLGEQPTTVIDFSDDDAVILRRGAGDQRRLNNRITG